MRKRLATGLALAMLAGAAIAQSSADMGRAGAAARAAEAYQDSRMGAAAVSIPRGAAMPSFAPAPVDPVAARQDGANVMGNAAAGMPGRGAADATGSGDAEGRAGPRLMWGTESSDTGLRRGQCPNGTVRRNQGCVPPGARSGAQRP